ncbi:unnamed protein product [Effrenium voratum]|nr:unnamed protein product [Effrenium voratum]
MPAVATSADLATAPKKSRVSDEYKELEKEDSLLQHNPRRWVMFPIQHEELYEFYKKHKASFWTAEEIDLMQDNKDWERLTEGEQHFVKHVLAFFAANGIVPENLAAQFSTEVQMPEARAFYGFQMAMENIHSETYSLLIEQYIKDPAEKDRLFEAVHGMPAVREKAEWAVQWMNREASFTERLVAFAVVEGIFFSGSCCALFWLKKRGLMPGLTFSNELISRDEGLHADFTCFLYGMLQKKLPEDIVHEMIRGAVEVERGFICGALPCDLIGMNKDLMTQYIEFVADRLLSALGHSKVFGSANPFDWMEMISLQGKTNFEKRAGEYQKAGVMAPVEPFTAFALDKALTELRSSHQKLQSDAKTKESNHNTLLERIQYMEKVMGDSAVKHSQELAEAHSKIDEMHSRVAKCEVHGESLESLKKSTASLASGKTRLEEHHASLGERVDYLEKALGDSADRHALEMASAHSKLAALHSRLGDEKEARERHASNTTENIVKERSTRETHHSSLEERLTYLETYLGESADKQGKSSVASRFEQKLKSEIFDLRELINNERQMRSRQGEAITEHLEAEKRAREALEEAVAHHMANHKQSMENHEKRVKEQFGHERTARERHFDHVEALVRQEKEARSQHHETHSENLQKESTAREATHKKFHDVLQKEKSLREQHHGHVQDLIGKERAARQQMEELLNRETQERTKHHETQSELVDSLQRTVGIFDALIRKEMEERKLEMKRVWAAIDSHTHDLDSKIKARCVLSRLLVA